MSEQWEGCEEVHWDCRIAQLEDENRRIRVELHTLRFKTSQQERFIWWVWNVYSKNVQELLLELEKTTFPVTPFGMSALVKYIKEGTNGIYDGTYLDVEISTDAKKGIPENKPSYNENANSLLRSAWMIANRNGEQTNWQAFKDRVYEELVREHEIKTSTDNKKESENGTRKQP